MLAKHVTQQFPAIFTYVAIFLSFIDENQNSTFYPQIECIQKTLICSRSSLNRNARLYKIIRINPRSEKTFCHNYNIICMFKFY